MDLFLRIATVVLFGVWRGYWIITAQKADREKPKTIEKTSWFEWKNLHRSFIFLLAGIVISQLIFGLSILPMHTSLFVQIVGFFLVMLGIGFAMIARYQLGTNWANSYEYQVKKKQELITSGVYAYVRNPIYTGLVVAVIGAELVAQSYLFFVFFIFFWGAYKQAKLEEEILEEYFGKAYTDYKKRSKMFIPFLF